MLKQQIFQELSVSYISLIAMKQIVCRKVAWFEEIKIGKTLANKIITKETKFNK